MSSDDITLIHRITSATIGALITSFFITPFNVVKVREQASISSQVSPPPSSCELANVPYKVSPAGCPTCGFFYYKNGLMDHCVMKNSSPLFAAESLLSPERKSSSSSPSSSSFKHAHVKPGTIPPTPTSTMESNLHGQMLRHMFQIARTEGVNGLYRGLFPTLLMAVPNTIVYFACYDIFKKRLDERSLSFATDHHYIESKSSKFMAWQHNLINPMIAGSSARTIAATVVTPLELMRTMIQSEKHSPDTSQHSLTYRFRHLISNHGLGYLFRGLLPTLYRDVPFSALYWMGYETYKSSFLPPSSSSSSSSSSTTILFHSFMGGFLSGMFAAFVTTPFDVLKTKMQVSIFSAAEHPEQKLERSSLSLVSLAKSFYKEHGIRGFFKGWLPRVSQVGPACAIMISTYEITKYFFKKSESSE